MRGLMKSVVALGALLLVGSVPSQANTLFPSGGALGSDPGLIPSVGATITTKTFSDTFTFSLTPGLWDVSISLTNPFKVGTSKSITGWELLLYKGSTLIDSDLVPGLNGAGQETVGLEDFLTAGSYHYVVTGKVAGITATTHSAYSGPFNAQQVVPISDTLPLFASGLALLAGFFMWRRRHDGSANAWGSVA